MSKKKTGNVLIIGDTHIPFERHDYLQFCVTLKEKYKCDTVVHIGDLVENHSINYHEHDPDLPNPKEELELARKHLVDWFATFPKVSLCVGNHDEMNARKAKTCGLSQDMVRSFPEIYQLPRGWEYKRSFYIDNVCYVHGTGVGGKFPHYIAAQKNMENTVIGHHHSVAGVAWLANERARIFGMSVGCGVNIHSKAFDYGKDNMNKPILGCGIVFNFGQDAQFIPMKLS